MLFLSFLSHFILSIVCVVLCSLKKKKNLLCPLLIITALSEAAVSYFVSRNLRSTNKVPHAFISFLGSRTTQGGGSPLSPSFCHFPTRPHASVC